MCTSLSKKIRVSCHQGAILGQAGRRTFAHGAFLMRLSFGEGLRPEGFSLQTKTPALGLAFLFSADSKFRHRATDAANQPSRKNLINDFTKPSLVISYATKGAM